MKGYSLHVGVGEVDKGSYGLKLNMASCTNDAFSMLKLMKRSDNYQEINKPLTGPLATFKNFKEELKRIIDISEKNNGGAYVVITFSGHGMSYKFDGQSEKVQFLCFYDRMVLEHEFTDLLRGFAKDVNVFVVVDSCYAFGIFDHRIHLKSKFNTKLEKAISKNDIETILCHCNNLKKYTSIVSNYQHVDGEIKNNCRLSACGKDQKTYGYNDGNNNSEFTGHLLNNMNDVTSYNQHKDLFDKISKSSGSSRPRILGENSNFFSSHKPFNINTNPKIMNWQIEINDTANTVHCTVQHPSYKFKSGGGSIIETYNKNHTLLDGVNLNDNIYDYEDGDQILILVLDKHHSSTVGATSSTIFNLQRVLTSTNTPSTFIIAFDNSPGNRSIKGPGKRTSKKVSDELGGE